MQSMAVEKNLKNIIDQSKHNNHVHIHLSKNCILFHWQMSSRLSLYHRRAFMLIRNNITHKSILNMATNSSMCCNSKFVLYRYFSSNITHSPSTLPGFIRELGSKNDSLSMIQSAIPTATTLVMDKLGVHHQNHRLSIKDTMMLSSMSINFVTDVLPQLQIHVANVLKKRKLKMKKHKRRKRRKEDRYKVNIK